MPVARALVDAHRRGARVQILLNDHWENRALKVVRAEIRHGPVARTASSTSAGRAVGGANDFNNLHTKFYSFSEAGTSLDVLAVGSANMTLNADRHQWNDLYFTSGNHELFRQFVGLFNDMRNDYDTRQEPMNFCGRRVRHHLRRLDRQVHGPGRSPSSPDPRNDLVLDMLARIQSLTPDAAGGQTRTRLALSMHTMRGRRGDYLAAALRKKYAEGCNVRVSYGLIGFHTKGILGAPTRRGRIPLRSTGLDYNLDDNFDLNSDGVDDLILDYYSHQKYFVIQGTYNGVPDTSMVLTGSTNWASLSTANDEIWFTVRGPVVAQEVPRELQLPVGLRAELAQCLHHHLRQLPCGQDGARPRRHDAEGLPDRASPRHHGGAGSLPAGPVLGSRLTTTDSGRHADATSRTTTGNGAPTGPVVATPKTYRPQPPSVGPCPTS